MTSWAPG